MEKSTDRASGLMTASILAPSLAEKEAGKRRGKKAVSEPDLPPPAPVSFSAKISCGMPWGQAGLISRARHGSTPCPATI